MYSDWYLQYFHADYPRLMIRFEDILYHQEDVIRKIQQCIGMNTSKPFIFQTRSAKWHGDPTDFTTALQKYVTESLRSRGLNHDDRQYAREKLHPDLMRTFQYKHIPTRATSEDLQGPFGGWENPAPDNSLGPKKKVGWHPLDELRKKNLAERKKQRQAKQGRAAVAAGGGTMALGTTK